MISRSSKPRNAQNGGRRRRPRRPNLCDLVKQAAKAGLTVTSAIATAEGVTLRFGEPVMASSSADLDTELAAFEARHDGQG